MNWYCPGCQVSWAGPERCCWSCGTHSTTEAGYRLTPGAPPVRLVDWRNAYDWTPTP